MAVITIKTPNSPRFSLSWALDKMLILLEKEGIHPVAPDIMAQHLGYSNSSNGQAATVLGTLRMYGLLLKAPHRKDVISEDIKRFRFTPYDEEKSQLANKWLRTPKLFSTVLTKYQGNLPSDPALRYELIREYNFTEETANKFIKILKESIDFANSFSSASKGSTNDFEEKFEDGIESEINSSNMKDEKMDSDLVGMQVNPQTPVGGGFKVQITGPGMNSSIDINEEEDLLIVEAMLRKVSKKLFSE
ncbi:hypothetical protein [Cellvibrio sp. PSBB023]|uniref:hypothetical protein n=1 Tax=Cellvibrio sp. PSBB023 TaxID=1945512 RepID=UPI0009902B20|nr:hypothetical protein [Cellvibrio sp. PSBB023]AQT61117.1 hypothetical protein B0D95_14200 [Cellvibrio sp. PSBB023]